MKRERLTEARLRKGWSQAYAAEQVEVTPATFSRWERGISHPYPVHISKMKALFGMSAEELDLAPEGSGMHRRQFLQSLALTSLMPQVLAYNGSPLSSSTVESLAMISGHYRIMLRNGDVNIGQALSAHLSTIQNALMCTANDSMRHDIWRILAQTQLISFAIPTNTDAQMKTYIELAISSARQCGDTHLQAGAIGHLAHFYWRKEHLPQKMLATLDQAGPLAKDNRALQGWFSLISAAAAAEIGNMRNCEAGLDQAMSIVVDIPDHDAYYTDFSMSSALACAIHCWLTAGDAQKAHDFLVRMHMSDLSDNRRASAFCDASKIYATLGDMDQAEQYAMQVVDKAVETRQLQVLPRLSKLASAIQATKPGNAQGRAIQEYVHDAQQRFSN